MKILIIAPDAYEHLLAARALFWQLKSQGHQLDIVAPVSNHWLVKYMPEFDNQLCQPFSHQDVALSQRFQLSGALREQNYERAIILDSSWLTALIPMIAFIPWRTGWRGAMRFFLINDIRLPPRISEAYNYTQAYLDLMQDSYKRDGNTQEARHNHLPPLALPDKFTADTPHKLQSLVQEMNVDSLSQQKAIDIFVNIMSFDHCLEWLTCQDWKAMQGQDVTCLVINHHYSQAQWSTLQAACSQVELVLWPALDSSRSESQACESPEALLVLMQSSQCIVTSEIASVLLSVALHKSVVYIGDDTIHQWLSSSEQLVTLSEVCNQLPSMLTSSDIPKA